MFQASSAARTFAVAVSSVNGGSGGRGGLEVFISPFYKVFAVWLTADAVWGMGMDDPIRVFTMLVLLASAVYVVVTNLQFRRQWPAMVERCRRRASALGMAAAMPAIETNRTLMIAVVSFAGALSGALAGLLLDASLVIVSAPPHIDHSGGDILVGAAFGAFAFAILANED